MSDGTQPGDVTRACHIVRGIAKHHAGVVGSQSLPVALGGKGIATQDAMLAKEPKVTRSSHWGGRSVNRDPFVFLIEPAPVQMKIDLPHREAADLEIDLR